MGFETCSRGWGKRIELPSHYLVNIIIIIRKYKLIREVKNMDWALHFGM